MRVMRQQQAQQQGRKTARKTVQPIREQYFDPVIRRAKEAARKGRKGKK